MLIYLSVTPKDLPKASVFHNRFAHVAYRIGSECQLTRQNLLLKTRGGLLSLSDIDCPHLSAPERLCRQLQQEYTSRNYTGIVADFEHRPTPDRIAFLTMLRSVLKRDNRPLYLPEAYAAAVPDSIAVICTAISGGQYRQRLLEAAERFGRAALDVQRLCMDFSVPTPGGKGTPLSSEEFQALKKQRHPVIFFSHELCARYFTYTQDGIGHFVLFDDADTLRRKIRLGRSMGFDAAFLTFPEVEDCLPQLFRR